ncbi:helicase-like transcription factor CHR28 isoform X1 [Silene latifolia]
MGTEIVEISSSLDSDFDLSEDDEVEVRSEPRDLGVVPRPGASSTRVLPNWRQPQNVNARNDGFQMERPKPSFGSDRVANFTPSGSGRGRNLYAGHRSQAESSGSASYGYQQDSNKRVLPSSLQPSGTRSKPNNYWENLSSSRCGNNDGFYNPVALGEANSSSFARDSFSRGNLNDQHTFDGSRPRILPHTLLRGKAVSNDPLQNMGFGEERVSGDESVIYQAALQDLSQPKKELDLPEGVLSISLLRHQKIALCWMVQKESTVHCLGGILADDQGLGKTISTIALVQKLRNLQMKFQSEKIDNKNAEALDLDDDDDDKGKKIDDANCNLVKTCNNQPETLNLDDDDDDDDNRNAPVTKELDPPKCSSSASSSRQTFSRKRPAAGTLIVCPATVLRQWARELDDKVAEEGKLSVLLYHGGNRTKEPLELAKYDVVLTTYAIVSNEVPKQPIVDEDDGELKFGERAGISPEFSTKKRKHPSTSGKKGKKGKKLDDSSFYSESGALARVTWFRVVLDEAQTIKNHRTQTARACCGLRAKTRWCLSGTPIQNSIDELYSYFRFLRHEMYSNYKIFCEKIKFPISRDPIMGYKKLQAVLKTLLLRRTKDTLLDGEPIICLPPKFINMKTVNFTIEERTFYAKLEAESRSQFKAYAAAGTVNQNYANILLMILRLRQACDHPLLVKGFNAEPARRTSMEKAAKLPRKTLLQLVDRLEAPSAICRICSDPAEDAVITICGHVFCYQCVGDYLTGDDTMCPVQRCKEQLCEDVLFSEATLRSCLSSDYNDHFSNGSSSKSSILSSEYSSSKIKAAMEILISNSKINSQCIELDDLEDTDVTNSSCAQVRTENVGNSASKGPIKTIVFSQWTRMLDLFEYSLNQHCIQYRRLDGSMSLVARDRAVREFNSDPEVIVMVMSLKAGNLGLNMVAACHVILLDLWWNPTTEDQAIDRAHRIGQTRPVTVSRITIKDTVEDRILALQEEKRKMVASAFGEDHVGGSGARLTIDDLKYLFLGSRVL